MKSRKNKVFPQPVTRSDQEGIPVFIRLFPCFKACYGQFRIFPVPVGVRGNLQVATLGIQKPIPWTGMYDTD